MNAPAAPTGPFGEPQEWPDHEAEQVDGTAQPPSIRLAVRLMWVGAALSLLGVVFTFVQRDELRDQIQENADEPLTENELDTAVAIGLTGAVLVGVVAISATGTIAIVEDLVAHEERSDVEETTERMLDDADFDAEIRHVEGDPGSQLVEIAETEGYDRIVLGGGQTSPMGKIKIGTTAEFVLLNSHTTVTLVR
jgi:nucleotide-binding universal stress UspA family protein